MATQDYLKFFITPFWANRTESYRNLNYIREDFNNPADVERWLSQGYENNFVGDLCDMRSPQPMWNERIVKTFEKYGWQDIGTSYYRMMPGTVLPTHSDLYKKYVELFDLQGQEHKIKRAIIFLEDWQPGHLSEVNGDVLTEWVAGTTIEWTYNTPHMAGNLGTVPRYTLQITGHL
jgi:hypothetical protein